MRLTIGELLSERKDAKNILQEQMRQLRIDRKYYISWKCDECVKFCLYISYSLMFFPT